MAIVVDKEQKKKDIALSCKDLFVNSNMNTLTISQIAKTAGIGKGTVYEYFKNKDEIVFELVNILMQEYNSIKEEKISKAKSTKEKVKVFYEFFYKEGYNDMRAIYKNFIAISLIAPKEEMIHFQTKCYEYYFHWMETVFSDGVSKGEIIVDSQKLVKGMFAVGEGMFISSFSTKSIQDLRKEINDYIDMIFSLIEVKEER